MVEAILIGNLGMLAYKQLKNNATRWIAIRGKSELLGIVATSSSISQIEKKLKKLMVYSLGPLLDYFSQGSVVPSSNFRRNFRNIQWCIEQGLKIAAEYSGKKWHNKMLFSSKTNSELQSLLEEANLGYKNLNNLYNSEILVALDGFRKETIYYMKEGVRNKKNLRNKLIEEEKDSEDFEKFLEHGLSYQMTKQEKTIEEDLGKSNPKVDKILREFFIKLEKNQNFGVLGIHNIPCDSCGRDKFYGHRYKCLSCADYNLCNDCYEQGNVTKGHKLSHVCLLIPTPFEEKPGHMEYEKILNLLIETNQFFAKSESFMNNDRNCDYCFQDITGIIFKASTQCLFDICKACRDTLKNTKNMNDNTIKRILHKSTSVDYEDYLYKKMKANQGEDKTQEEIKKEANLQSKFIQSLTLTGEEKIYAMLPNGEEFEEQWYGLLELKKNIPIPEYLQENYRKVGKIILKEGPIDGKCFHIIKIPEETSGGNMKTKISRNISLGIDIKSNYIANYDGYAFNKYKNPSKNNIIQPERSVTLSFPKFAHSLLDSIDNLSYIRKLSMLIQVTTAIQKIHKLGLVHGNLRPGSIYLEKVQGLHNTIVPRIGDFLPFLTGSRNISANTDVRNSREKDNLLWLNNIANTDDDGKKYVAPEWKTSNYKQLEKCGEKIDIYSLGQIIREVFIKDKSNPKYTRKELFYGVVKHCIAKMPENRPDAKEILEYLRKFESDINQKMMKPSEVVKRKTYKMKIPKLNIKFEEAYKKALRKHFSFRHKVKFYKRGWFTILSVFIILLMIFTIVLYHLLLNYQLHIYIYILLLLLLLLLNLNLYSLLMLEAGLTCKLAIMAWDQLQTNSKNWVINRSKSSMHEHTEAKKTIVIYETKLQAFIKFKITPLLDYFSEGSVTPSSIFRRNFRDLQWTIESALKIIVNYNKLNLMQKYWNSNKIENELKVLVDEIDIRYEVLTNLYNSEILKAVGEIQRGIGMGMEQEHKQKNIELEIPERDRMSNIENIGNIGNISNIGNIGNIRSISNIREKERNKLNRIMESLIESQKSGEVSVHSVWGCSHCNIREFFGYSYKCLSCIDYNLCGDCYDRSVTSKGHKSSHICLLITSPLHLHPTQHLPHLLHLLIETNQFQILANQFTNPHIICEFCYNEIKGNIYKSNEFSLFDLCGGCLGLLRVSRQQGQPITMLLAKKYGATGYKKYIYSKLEEEYDHKEPLTPPQIINFQKVSQEHFNYVSALSFRGEHKFYATLPQDPLSPKSSYGMRMLEEYLEIDEGNELEEVESGIRSSDMRKVYKVKGNIDRESRVHVFSIPGKYLVKEEGHTKLSLSKTFEEGQYTRMCLGFEIKSNYLLNYDGYYFKASSTPSEGGKLYASLPKLSGTLFSHMPSLSFQQKLSFAIQISLALSKIHHKGLIHGCLSPSTVYVQILPGERGKIARIGCLFPFLSGHYEVVSNKQIKKSRDCLQWVQMVSIDGLEVFAAPEWKNVKKIKECSSAIDIYSLGVILSHLFTSGSKQIKKELEIAKGTVFTSLIRATTQQRPNLRPNILNVLDYLCLMEKSIQSLLIRPSEVVKRKMYLDLDGVGTSIYIEKENARFVKCYKHALRDIGQFGEKKKKINMNVAGGIMIVIIILAGIGLIYLWHLHVTY